MPFDLVIDGGTADGQEVRVGKTSLAGQWGAVAGSIRYFADRFGKARASIEGTTIPYELIRAEARRGAPFVRVTGPRKHQTLTVFHPLEYFGFELDSVSQPIKGSFPADLADAARAGLVRALLSGEVAHPDQGRVRRAAHAIREYWRRSGGTLPSCSDERIQADLLAQVASVESWKGFQETHLSLAEDGRVDPATRAVLDALPGTVRIFGDTTALEYDVERGRGIVRLRLREGQARRLTENDLPGFDRPVRFAVVRGGEAPLEADSLDALRALLRRAGGKMHPHRKRGSRAPRPRKRRR